MAIVKIKFIRHSKTIAKYIQDDRDPNDIVYSYDCSPETMALDFDLTKQLHCGRGEVNAIHVIQSWNSEESKKHSVDEFNTMGRELITEHFPGHQYVATTHTGTGKIHNHLVVNPWNSETGKKVENKKYHLHDLRDINDNICRKRGLSVISRDVSRQQTNIPDVARRIMKYNGRSHIVDLMTAADFARACSTSYDEYVRILGKFDIGVRVEEKNISYSNPGMSRNKRGDKLGKMYDKAGLEAVFKKNDMRFRTHPLLKSYMEGKVDEYRVKPGAIKEISEDLSKNSKGGYQPPEKDYSAYTKQPRREADGYPHDLELKGSMIPLEEIEKARRGDILEYCKRNNIGLDVRKDGTKVLKGREYVEIGQREWVNGKNRTRGTLIEFVAAYKNKSFVQAMAEINRNKRLLVFEEQFGEIERKFTSFYIPSNEKGSNEPAKSRIINLLQGKGIGKEVADVLHNSKQVQVSKEGAIRFFGRDDEGGAEQWSVAGDGTWKSKSLGKIKSPFYSVSGAENSVRVYSDVFSYVKDQGNGIMNGPMGNTGVLCLVQPDPKIVDSYINRNKHVSTVSVVQSVSGKEGGSELDFFNVLKKRYLDLGVSVEKSGLDSRDKGRGLEMSF